MKKKGIHFFKPKKENTIGQWLAEEGISAGFPCPADDFKEIKCIFFFHIFYFTAIISFNSVVYLLDNLVCFIFQILLRS